MFRKTTQSPIIKTRQKLLQKLTRLMVGTPAFLSIHKKQPPNSPDTNVKNGLRVFNSIQTLQHREQAKTSIDRLLSAVVSNQVILKF